MPRGPRIPSQTGLYHCMTRGVNKKQIFHRAKRWGALLISSSADMPIITVKPTFGAVRSFRAAIRVSPSNQRRISWSAAAT